jgi:arylsulfatase I/J
VEDHAAAAANDWLRARHLPQLKPVDAVPQWGFILNNTNARKSSLHLSEQAILKWPYKLVVGKQHYSVWQGELYPNCSTVNSMDDGNGPSFIDLKVFNRRFNVQPTEEGEDRVTWASDCQSGCFYNVELDPTEHHNLADDSKFAGMISEMREELIRLNSQLFSPGRGNPKLNACNNAIDIGGFYGPFVDVDGWYTPVPPAGFMQRLKNQALKELLKATDTASVERGVEAAAQAALKILRHTQAQRRLDKCTNSSETGEMPSAVVI